MKLIVIFNPAYVAILQMHPSIKQETMCRNTVPIDWLEKVGSPNDSSTPQKMQKLVNNEKFMRFCVFIYANIKKLMCCTAVL